MSRSWILVGMMGAGKSAVGRALCELTGREFVDTDRLLQNRLGRSIPQLFRIYGESTFRDHETAILRSLLPGHDVISTGGGIVIREPNWTEMRRLGTTVFLEVPIEQLVDRLEQSKKRRPLLEVENWQGRVEDLLEQRLPLYRQADLTVQVETEDVMEVARMVMGVLEAHE